ncbi:MAG TPA: SpoIIIAH-like family protein [Clostridia bacterium]|nr:SpoIIIAH-like family protein [Clostridia bacterium]
MKMKLNKKKVLVLVAMVVLLVATGVLNWALNTNFYKEEIPTVTTVETFFSAYRTDRTTTRQEEFLLLDAILSSENSSEEAKVAAENQKLEIALRVEDELVLEGLIKSKGFADAIVTMTSKNVNVVVNTEEITNAQATQILDIITSGTTYLATNVKIIPYK